MRSCCSSPRFVCAPIFRASQTLWKIETGAVQSHETAQGAPASSSTAIPLHPSWPYSKLLHRDSGSTPYPTPAFLAQHMTHSQEFSLVLPNPGWRLCNLPTATRDFWTVGSSCPSFHAVIPVPPLTCATRECHTSPAPLCSKLSQLIQLSSQPHRPPNFHIQALLLDAPSMTCSVPKLHF